MKREYCMTSGKVVPAKNPGEVQILQYIQPNKEEILELTGTYLIDEHNIVSSLDPDELGRLEFEDDHTMVILKRPKNYCKEDNLVFKVTSIGVFIFADKMILIMSEDIEIFEGRYSFKVNTLAEVFLKLFYGTISHFLGHLKVINMMCDSLEEKMQASMENKYIFNMYTLEKSLVYYLNGITSNTGVIDRIKLTTGKFKFSQDDIDVLDDIIIENTQCKKIAEIYMSILQVMIKSRDAFLNTRINYSMKRLTLINSIFMPLTLISGIFGMSEWSTITGGAVNWYISFPVFFGLALAIGFVTYRIFKWRGWT